jgi:thiamine-phosphate pyrophosphorylase
LPPHFARGRLRGLYVITDETMGGGHLAIARAALAGGAGIVQLRDKSTALPALLTIGHELRRMTREAGALFIVNDRIDIALALNADGVHLGPDDIPVLAARRVLGPHRLLGVSCCDREEAAAAQRDGADYIGVGAVYGTSSKHDAGDAIGVAALAAVVESTTLPVAAIGGINRRNIAPVVATGVAMACVISAVAGAGDAGAMAAAARELAETCQV